MPNVGAPTLYELVAHPELYIQNYPYHTYYKGRVVDVADPECRGRVRVRIESIWKSSPKSQDNQMAPIPNDALPWADVLIHGQNSKSGTFYVPPLDTYVIVAFEKGHENFPIILGGWFAREEAPTAAMGGDQTGETANDLKGLDKGVSTAGGGTIDEPDNPYAATYPENTVLRTTSGHLIELDNTAGGERINIAHKSGTWVEFHPDGTLVFGVQGKRYTVVEGDDGEHIKGNQDVVVDGTATNSVGGDYTEEILGRSLVEVSARSEHKAAAITIESMSTLDLTAPGITTIGPGTAPGNVVTTLTHPIDYITGIPIIGVPTVQAG